MNSVKKELNEFERSLESTENNIRQLINDTFYMITQQIRTAIGGVNFFERILGTTDNNIQQLISTINEANPNQNETVKNYVSCQSQVLFEEHYNESYQGIDRLSENLENAYKNNSRRAIEILRNEKSKLQLIFNTWQSEKSNMTCNRPENISEDDFNKLLQLIQRRQYTNMALTYYKCSEE
uniref:Uncharacterized protein n=1 Tax=Schistosoma japonicum TaxID=6182 RepID=Q5BWW3_SCHJA|nr:unknown [Schistosoma japonicum]